MTENWKSNESEETGTSHLSDEDLIQSSRASGRKPWIFFDYDDTLGGLLVAGEIKLNEWAYMHALEEFSKEFYSLYGLDTKYTLSVQYQIDSELCKSHGFERRTRFAESLEQTYELLMKEIGYSPNPVVTKRFYDLGMGVFNHKYVPLPGAINVLDILGRDFRLCVVTKGETEEQFKKGLESGILPMVEEYIPVSFKNREDWANVFDQCGLTNRELRKAWAVGNSPKSDVNVPLTFGLNAVHVASGGWKFEQEAYVKPMHGSQLYTVPTISDVIRVIHPTAVLT